MGNRTVTEGNPALVPSNGGAAELIYGYKKKYFLGVTASYYKRLFTQINEVIGTDTLLVKWQNWGNQSQYNFWFFTSKDLFKDHLNLTFNTNLGYYKRSFNRDLTRSSASSDNVQLYLTLNQTYNNIFSKNLKLYLNSSFNTPTRFGLWSDDRSSFRVDLLAAYSFSKADFRVSLMINDIFKYNDRHVYNINQTDLQKTSVLTNSDARSIRIGISKSFGNQKAKKLQKRETSNEEEKKRAQ